MFKTFKCAVLYLNHNNRHDIGSLEKSRSILLSTRTDLHVHMVWVSSIHFRPVNHNFFPDKQNFKSRKNIMPDIHVPGTEIINLEACQCIVVLYPSRISIGYIERPVYTMYT